MKKRVRNIEKYEQKLSVFQKKCLKIEISETDISEIERGWMSDSKEERNWENIESI